MAPRRERHELNLQLGFFKASAIGLPAIFVLAFLAMAGLTTKVFGLW